MDLQSPRSGWRYPAPLRSSVGHKWNRLSGTSQVAALAQSSIKWFAQKNWGFSEVVFCNKKKKSGFQLNTSSLQAKPKSNIWKLNGSQKLVIKHWDLFWTDYTMTSFQTKTSWIPRGKRFEWLIHSENNKLGCFVPPSAAFSARAGLPVPAVPTHNLRWENTGGVFHKFKGFHITYPALLPTSFLWRCRHQVIMKTHFLLMRKSVLSPALCRSLHFHLRIFGGCDNKAPKVSRSAHWHHWQTFVFYKQNKSLRSAEDPSHHGGCFQN